MPTVRRTDFLNVIKAEPGLCAVGLATSEYWARPRGKIDFDSNRQEFVRTGFGQFKNACGFLGGCLRRKTVNRKVGSSYGLKHIAERWADDYISNGAFIAAAIHLGIPVEQIEDSPNVYIAVSSRCPLVKEKKA